MLSERVRNAGKSKRLPICFMLMKTRKPSITKDYPCHNPFLMFWCNGKTHLQHSLNSIGNSLITLGSEVLSSFYSRCHDCQNFFVVKSLSEFEVALRKLKKQNKNKIIFSFSVILFFSRNAFQITSSCEWHSFSPGGVAIWKRTAEGRTGTAWMCGCRSCHGLNINKHRLRPQKN